MASGGIDLRTLLEHDIRMIQSIVETSRKLVLELDATSYWITSSNEIFKTLGNICGNIGTMMDACEQDWQGGKSSPREEEAKLWKTAAGLYKALPAEQKKFTEQVTRARRQRIMGEDPPEDVELEPETLELMNKTFVERSTGLQEAVAGLLERVGRLPEGLAPPAVEPDKPADGPAPKLAVQVVAEVQAVDPLAESVPAEPDGADSPL